MHSKQYLSGTKIALLPTMANTRLFLYSLTLILLLANMSHATNSLVREEILPLHWGASSKSRTYYLPTQPRPGQTQPDRLKIRLLYSVDEENDSQKRYPLTIQCNQGVILDHSFSRPQKSTHFKNWIYDSQKNGDHLTLEILDPNTICDISVNDRQVRLIPEIKKHPALKDIRENSDFCHNNCPLDQGIRFLGDPEEALQARIQALTGQRLLPEELRNPNPRLLLNFSNAPKLDLIIVTSLLLNNDFFGNLLAQSLIYHAQQGALVKVYLSPLFIYKKDQALLEKMQKASDNIQVSLFDYRVQNWGPHEWMNNIHRSMHVKTLLTYSATQNTANTLITGGRNLSDTYFYSEKPDYSQFPEVVQYGTFQYPFAYFDDLDFELKNSAFIAPFARQLLAFLETDKKEMTFHQEAMPDPMNLSENSISYQISAPFLDDRLLEKNLITLIDQSHQRIRLLSPYLRLTKEILAALERARARNVKIEIVTTYVLDGDIVPFVLKASISEFLNKIYQKYDVYRYYRDPTGIMHAKAALFDKHTLLLGSINLNRRSFAHDIEIGYFFKDQNSIESFNRLFEERYLSQSKKMTEPLKIPFYQRPLLKFLGNMI